LFLLREGSLRTEEGFAGDGKGYLGVRSTDQTRQDCQRCAKFWVDVDKCALFKAGDSITVIEDEMNVIIDKDPDCAALNMECEPEILAACGESVSTAYRNHGEPKPWGSKFATVWLQQHYDFSEETVKLAAQTTCDTCAQRFKELDRCNLFHHLSMTALLAEMKQLTGECAYKGVECEPAYKQMCGSESTGN